MFNFAELELFAMKSLPVICLPHAELFEIILSGSSQDPRLQHVFVLL